MELTATYVRMVALAVVGSLAVPVVTGLSSRLAVPALEAPAPVMGRARARLTDDGALALSFSLISPDLGGKVQRMLSAAFDGSTTARPFFYMPKRAYPVSYLVMVGLIVALSLSVITRLDRRGCTPARSCSRPSWRRRCDRCRRARESVTAPQAFFPSPGPRAPVYSPACVSRTMNSTTSLRSPVRANSAS